MKLPVIMLCVSTMLISLRTFAQVRTEKSPQESSSRLYAYEVEKYRGMKKAGAIMTGVGIAFFITGLVIVDNTNDTADNSDTPWRGAGLAVTGIGLFGAGIPIWSVGGYKYKKYKNLQSSAAALSFRPRHNGLTIVLKF